MSDPALIEITPARGPVNATARLPGSKSIANRALLLAGLARGESRIAGLPDCDDTRVMAAALQQLGADVRCDWAAATATVNGCGGPFSAPQSDLFVANSGTTLRFLTAALAIGGGQHRLHGDPRMHERPVQDLVTALRELGCRVTAESPGGCPPVTIHGARCRGGRAEVRATASSQYLSGLLMAAPLASGPVRIELTGEPVSGPYITMTLALMERFGVRTEAAIPDLAGRVWSLQPGEYRACAVAIEPDASAASYFFAVAAIAGGTVVVEGLDRASLQGDVGFVELLQQMGCRVDWSPGRIAVTGPAGQGITCQMTDISDTAQTLAAVGCCVAGPTTIRGIAHNRLKETDRIGNLVTELNKTGATASATADGLVIVPGPLRPATLDSWGDHRMAMSLALLGLRQPGIRIQGAGCVRKTFPGFFAELSRVAGTAR